MVVVLSRGPLLCPQLLHISLRNSQVCRLTHSLDIYRSRQQPILSSPFFSPEPVPISMIRPAFGGIGEQKSVFER